jgi:uncharacterized protein (DUF488 family)
LYTIGYEGRQIEDVTALLVDAGVELLVDVRKVPMSRRPAFRKNALASALEECGIGYEGMSELGTPQPLRDYLADTKNYEVFFRRFGKNLDRCDDALYELTALARENRVAILCFEADALRCHRSVIAQRVEKSLGQPTNHLGAPILAGSAR